MSLVTAIRDYIDFVNSNYDSIPADADLASLILPTLGYLITSLRYGIVYLLSFQWLRDLVYLPVLVPQLTLSLLREHAYPLDNPVLNFFAFLEEPAYKDSKLFVGFLNSFFACLPISAAHLLSARRLLIQGIPAGVAAGSGIVVGQCWFVACVVLGLRGLIVPWLSLEPLNHVLGVGLLVHVVYQITHERRIRLVKWTERGELIQYFVLSFLLMWCEQSSIFQYLGNLTVDAAPTALDTFSSSNGVNSLLIDGSYLLGFIFGSCFFTIVFGCASFLLRDLWIRGWSTTASRVTNQLRTTFLVLLIAFSFASVPYYGVDYLLTNRLGFLPEDKSLDQTIVYPSRTTDISQILGRLSDYKSFDTDVSVFDRGVYLEEHKAMPQSFEDLNYQGEYNWTKRVSKFVKYLTRAGRPSAWYKLLSSGSRGPREDGPPAPSEARGEGQSPRVLRGSVRPSPSHQPRAEAVGSAGDDGSVMSGKRQTRPIPREAMQGESVTVSDLVNLESDLGPDEPEWSSTANGDNGDISYDISYMGEGLEEDEATEKQFFSLFGTGLSPLFLADTPGPSTLERSLKRKYNENPIYSLLLSVDIDSFLSRQPASHMLSPLEEKTISQKRQILGHYYDTLRQYSQLQNWDEFQAVYNGSKSFANRVYNQQFKGTLKVVRRLFSITLDGKEAGEADRVLRFDQPLFHEASRGQKQPLNLHEELVPFERGKGERYPFLEATNPRPLYAGWDEDLRRLVLTNRATARSQAMYQAPSQDNKAYGRFQRIFAKGAAFTAWPIPQDLLAKPRSLSRVPYNVAFDSSRDPQKRTVAEKLQFFSAMEDQGAVGGSTWDMSRWPANLRLIENRSGVVPWTRGGFVWPGHAELKTSGRASSEKGGQAP
jgi:hypothetical protein